MANDVVCLHPQIIMNPLAGELISRFGNYTIRDKEFCLTKFRNLLYDFKPKKIHPSLLNIGHCDLDSCFITNRDTLETYPLYLEVPCGHCETCKESKMNSFVHRCKLETMAYDCKPLFLTLTYDELHKKECGVYLRDLQLFFKRLRVNLYRRGYRETLRYVAVSEYGHKTHRPHYHAIIWNLRQTNILAYREIKDIIVKSWSQGFCMFRFVDPSDDKCFYYTSKYLAKDCDVPSGCNKTFMVSSNRNGGIGAPFLDRIKPDIRKRLNTHAKFVNRFNGKVEPLQFNRYVLNRLFPSSSRSLPYSVKRIVRDFVRSYEVLKSRNYESVSQFYQTSVDIESFWSKLFYVPRISSKMLLPSQEFEDTTLVRNCLNAEVVLSRFSCDRRRTLLSFLPRCDNVRKRFLEKLFLSVKMPNLENKAYNFRRSTALAIEREVL